MTRRMTKKEKERLFDLDISLNVILKIDEIWPDGDWPDDPTVEDVARLIAEETTGIVDLVEKWGIDTEDEGMVMLSGPSSGGAFVRKLVDWGK